MGTQKVKVYEEPKEGPKEKEVEKKKEVKEEIKKEVEEKPEVEAEKPKKAEGPKTRGKNWQKVSGLLEKSKVYSVSEALDFLKKNTTTKFDSSVEVHVRFQPKKGQVIRGTLFLPHGTGKEKKIVIFNPDLLPQIEKGKIDFDVLLAKPEDMATLAKVAKILGPKGLMPNPKSGTITEKPEEAIKRIKSGQIEFKADAQNNLHQMIGKISWDVKKLEENLKVLMEGIRQHNPVSVIICTTMSPGIRVEI